MISHDYLDTIFNRNSAGAIGSGDTTDTYRYANLANWDVALPTVGGGNIGQNQPGTAIGFTTASNGSNAVNATYNDLLAVWDAYNGTGTGTNSYGVPPGWYAGDWGYWSATASASLHAYVKLLTGVVNTDGFWADETDGAYVMLQVFSYNDLGPPTSTNLSASYEASRDTPRNTSTLVLTGTDYATLLEARESATTDIKSRLDWSKLSWDIDGNSTTTDVGFALSDISSAKVSDDTHLTVVLTSAKGKSLETTSGFYGATADTLDIAAGFAKDLTGNVSTTDAKANGVITRVLQDWIDLGTFGKLINPVTVDGGSKYYHWDTNGDGIANAADLVTHDYLDGIFTQDINGVTGAGFWGTNDTYRYTTMYGAHLALPTVNGPGATYLPYLEPLFNYGYAPGTAVGSATASNGSNAANAPYSDLLAVWDAYNGTGPYASNWLTKVPGTPPGWMGDNYWSATATLLGHADVRPASGKAEVFLDSWRDYVALQVLSVTADTVAPTVTNTSASYEPHVGTPEARRTLTLTGTNYLTLLESGETATTDIKGRLNWSKLTWDINSDNATTPDVSFSLNDISSAKVTDGTHLTVELTNTKGLSLQATNGFSGSGPDALDIAAGFATDYWGNASTSDARANASLTVTVDTVAPTVTNTGATYEGSADTPTNISTLVLAGTNFNTLLEAAETANTDIKGRLDWSKLSWDINSDNATTADVSFAQGDISSANVTDSTHLTIVLTNEKGASLEATSGFRGNSPDAIDIAAGFSTDYWGNAATTDTVANESITSLAETWINLGSYGKLIKPVQVDGGKTYFFWDRSGNGIADWDPVPGGGLDATNHNELDQIFNQDINGVVGGGGDTDNTYRYASLTGDKYSRVAYGDGFITSKVAATTVRLALPTAGMSGLDDIEGADAIKTAVGSEPKSNGSNAINSDYNDYLAIWDAYNGTAVGNVSQIGSNPPGWKAYGYWSATKAAPMDSATVHFIVDQHGGVRPLWDNYFMPYHVAVEVL